MSYHEQLKPEKANVDQPNKTLTISDEPNENEKGAGCCIIGMFQVQLDAKFNGDVENELASINTFLILI